MPLCKLCNNLKKKAARFRLAFDFTPGELEISANTAKCLACKILLDGVLRFEGHDWIFSNDISRIYAHGSPNGKDSLTLELHFKDERPKLDLEFYDKCEESNSEAIVLRSSVSPLPPLRVPSS